MTIPTTKASTANVDQGSDKISLARADIKQNIDNVNEIIDHLGEGNNTLIIPLTGFVVVESAVEGYSDSAGASSEKYRMALLGGAYRKRGQTENGSLTSATSSYGGIPGATVNTATPTLNNPTGYSFSGTNTAANITNGVLTNTGTATIEQVLGSVNLGISQTCYVGYGEGYDSYVTLPAGTYKVKMLSTVSTVTNGLYPAETYVNLDIWNKTDDSKITGTNLNVADWSKDAAAIFTLGAQKDIQFFNSYGTTPPADKLDAILFGSITITGNVEGSGTAQTIATWFPNIPERFGWVDLVPNVYIEITKIA
jgi:hypothetical protein